MFGARHALSLSAGILVVGLLAACESSNPRGAAPAQQSVPAALSSPRQSKPKVPPLVNRHDVYAADRPGMLAPAVRRFPPRVYVPNSESNTVSVIDPRSFKVIDEFPVGALPQHVTP